jgi:hypothetical protein
MYSKGLSPAIQRRRFTRSIAPSCPTSACPAPPDVPGTRNTATVTASAIATPMATRTCLLVPANRFTTNQYRDKGVAQPTSASRD